MKNSLPRSVVVAVFTVSPALATSGDDLGPAIFAPDIISTAAAEAAVTFRGDGREAFFQRSEAGVYRIMTTRRSRGDWSPPVVAPFSMRWMNLEPALAPDGRHLIFVSNRPVDENSAPIDGVYVNKRRPGMGGNLWRVNRLATGWSQPYRLSNAINSNGSLFEPSIAANGDLYYQQADNQGGPFSLYVAKAQVEGYAPPQRLALQAPPGSSDMDPAIARDGSYLLFASDRGTGKNQLYIAFRKGIGWSAPRPLGADVNGSGSVGDPRIGPNRRLYFTSRRRLDPTMVEAGAAWNNGQTNIWSTPFDVTAWRAQ